MFGKIHKWGYGSIALTHESCHWYSHGGQGAYASWSIENQRKGGGVIIFALANLVRFGSTPPIGGDVVVNVIERSRVRLPVVALPGSLGQLSLPSLRGR